MKSPSRWLVLSAALALGGVAIWLTGIEQGEETQAELFPELTLETLNAVQRIEITERATHTASIYRGDDNVWHVGEYHDYPADPVKIRQLLSDLKDAVKLEQKTSSPEYYASLGVADPAAEEGAGHLLKFTDANKTWQLIVGNPSRQVSRGQYVRKAGEAESWLINVSLDLSGTPTEWLDKEIVHIEPSEISTMTISHPDDEKPFVIARDANSQFELTQLPQGRVLKGQSELSRIATVTDYLQFKNVYPRDNNEIKLPEQHITTQLMTADGLSLTVKAYKTEENDIYFTLDVGGTSTRADELKQQLPNWLYQVSNSIYTSIDKSLDSLLKDA